MTGTIDEGLHYRLLEAPAEEFHVIVRTDGEPQEVVAQCRRVGIHIYRQFRLMPALALTARGEVLLQLADNPHVMRIEPDREVGV